MTVQVRVEVLGNERLGERIWRLSLEAPEVASAAQAGQFVTLRVSNNTDPLLRRPFGIHRVEAVGPGSVEVLYRVVGKGTREMTRLRKGWKVDLLGPIGRGFGDHPERREHWLVAGGMGIAPMPFLARHVMETNGTAHVRLFYGGSTAKDLVGSEGVEELAFETIRTTEDGSRYEKGRVTGPLRRFLADVEPKICVVYACGPLPMLAAAARLCAERNVPCEVSLESQMACGFGTCMGCVTKTIPLKDDEAGITPALCDNCAEGGVQECYQRICTDGPVFDAREIVWGEE